jgi:NAD(P)H-dependent FMN reductase
MKTILTVAASLRAQSNHRTVLQIARGFAPEGVELKAFDGLAAIPPFNPDQDAATDLPGVLAWRGALKSADALLIGSPEYAHAVPGVLKNALDWVVGSGELVDKPVGLITALPVSGKNYAREQLHEILKTMSAKIVADAWVDLPGLKGKLGSTLGPYEEAILRRALKAFSGLVAKA